eukprot:Rhum_TRINITY_DN12405_c1_g1::Rhum_TRINITY_DN12405_c1_g1_i1::g.51748::m.51748
MPFWRCRCGPEEEKERFLPKSHVFVMLQTTEAQKRLKIYGHWAQGVALLTSEAPGKTAVGPPTPVCGKNGVIPAFQRGAVAPSPRGEGGAEDSDRMQTKIEHIFLTFDEDKDGLWDMAEVRVWCSMCDGGVLTLQQYERVCDTVGGVPSVGLQLPHVALWYRKQGAQMARKVDEHFAACLRLEEQRAAARGSSAAQQQQTPRRHTPGYLEEVRQMAAKRLPPQQQQRSQAVSSSYTSSTVSPDPRPDRARSQRSQASTLRNSASGSPPPKSGGGGLGSGGDQVRTGSDRSDLKVALCQFVEIPQGQRTALLAFLRGAQLRVNAALGVGQETRGARRALLMNVVAFLAPPAVAARGSPPPGGPRHGGLSSLGSATGIVGPDGAMHAGVRGSVGGVSFMSENDYLLSELGESELGYSATSSVRGMSKESAASPFAISPSGDWDVSFDSVPPNISVGDARPRLSIDSAAGGNPRRYSLNAGNLATLNDGSAAVADSPAPPPPPAYDSLFSDAMLSPNHKSRSQSQSQSQPPNPADNRMSLDISALSGRESMERLAGYAHHDEDEDEEELDGNTHREYFREMAHGKMTAKKMKAAPAARQPPQKAAASSAAAAAVAALTTPTCGDVETYEATVARDVVIRKTPVDQGEKPWKGDGAERIVSVRLQQQDDFASPGSPCPMHLDARRVCVAPPEKAVADAQDHRFVWVLEMETSAVTSPSPHGRGASPAPSANRAEDVVKVSIRTRDPPRQYLTLRGNDNDGGVPGERELVRDSSSTFVNSHPDPARRTVWVISKVPQEELEKYAAGEFGSGGGLLMEDKTKAKSARGGSRRGKLSGRGPASPGTPPPAASVGIGCGGMGDNHVYISSVSGGKVVYLSVQHYTQRDEAGDGAMWLVAHEWKNESAVFNLAPPTSYPPVATWVNQRRSMGLSPNLGLENALRAIRARSMESYTSVSSSTSSVQLSEYVSPPRFHAGEHSMMLQLSPGAEQVTRDPASAALNTVREAPPAFPDLNTIARADDAAEAEGAAAAAATAAAAAADAPSPGASSSAAASGGGASPMPSLSSASASPQSPTRVSKTEVESPLEARKRVFVNGEEEDSAEQTRSTRASQSPAGTEPQSPQHAGASASPTQSIPVPDLHPVSGVEAVHGVVCFTTPETEPADAPLGSTPGSSYVAGHSFQRLDTAAGMFMHSADSVVAIVGSLPQALKPVQPAASVQGAGVAAAVEAVAEGAKDGETSPVPADPVPSTSAEPAVVTDEVTRTDEAEAEAEVQPAADVAATTEEGASAEVQTAQEAPESTEEEAGAAQDQENVEEETAEQPASSAEQETSAAAETTADAEEESAVEAEAEAAVAEVEEVVPAAEVTAEAQPPSEPEGTAVQSTAPDSKQEAAVTPKVEKTVKGTSPLPRASAKAAGASTPRSSTSGKQAKPAAKKAVVKKAVTTPRTAVRTATPPAKTATTPRGPTAVRTATPPTAKAATTPRARSTTGSSTTAAPKKASTASKPAAKAAKKPAGVKKPASKTTSK